MNIQLLMPSYVFYYTGGQGNTSTSIRYQMKYVFSFLEPLGQLPGQMTPRVTENFGQFFVMMFLPMLLSNYPMGVAQAYLFRKYGFLASFTLRMGYYIVWHIVYGSMIYPLLNA